MRIDIVTIFPEYLAPLELSLIGRARRAGLVEIAVHDLRDFTHDRHRTVDDAPAGGGAGMGMRPEPWGEVLDRLCAPGGDDPSGADAPTPTLLVPSPSGERFDQPMAHELAGLERIAFAGGRYEGIDERVLDEAATRMSVRPVIDWLKLLVAEDIPPEALRAKDSKAAIPPLHGALLKNEQDVHLFERLVFMTRAQRST